MRILPAAVILSIASTWPTNRTEPAAPQTASAGVQENQIATEQFKLLTPPRGFSLQFVSDGKIKRVDVPRDWLIPQDAEKEEEEEGA